MPLSQLLRQSWDRLPKAAREQLKAVPVVGSVISRVGAATAPPSTPLWVPPGHFYSPIPATQDVRAHAPRIFDRSATTLPGITLNAQAQRHLLETLAPYLADLPFEDGPRPGLRYHLDNAWFCHADGLILHALLRHLRPRRLVEVGSGFSSAAILDTRERFLGEQPALTFIEPNPQRLLELLRPQDHHTVQLLAVNVQDVPLAVFEALGDGDILLVDSSHVSKTGSDVNHLLFEVLPRLARGVYVHFHDVFWPFEYLEEWVVEGRAWNEAYLLRAFLQYNPAFEIVLFNDWAGRTQQELLRALMPRFLRNTGGSLWLRKVAG